MKKLVKFMGKIGKVIACDDPTALEVGKTYEVVSENYLGWQRNYHLKGEKGEFNAKWFIEVTEENAEK